MKKNIYFLIISLFFVACGSESSTHNDSKTINDNTQIALNPPKVNDENISTQEVKNIDN